jgi:hypothetical protein
MSEPATSVVLTNVAITSVTGAGVVILGVHTGLDYPTMIAGLAGGATALSYGEPGTPFKRACEVISASLLAGYISPAVALGLFKLAQKFNFVSVDDVAPQGLVLGTAFLVAYLAHGVLLPGFRKMVNALVGRYS